MLLSDLTAEANAQIIGHHERGHFTADQAIDRLTANGLDRREAMKALGYDPDCDSALVPFGRGDVVHCVKGARHDGLHETPNGVQWADLNDGA